MDKVECPYCGEEVEINNDDGHGMELNVVYEEWCEHCNKNFTFTTSISYSYDSEKADCLNGLAEHQWKLSDTFPISCSSMRCSVCDDIRSLTADEWNDVLKNYKDDLYEEDIERIERKISNERISKNMD